MKYVLLLLLSFQAVAQLDYDVAFGAKPQMYYVHKFGENDAVGTSLVPVSQGGVYRTPTSAVTLAAISTDADDTLAGAGAQQITVIYLDSNWVEQTDVIDMNGATESTDTITDVLRLYRVFVSRSGTYATQSAASQQGTITVRVSGAGETWAVLETVATGFGVGQSQIGAYTVPAGYTAFILSSFITVDGNKEANVYFFTRTNADDITTPFTGTLRVQNEYKGVSGSIVIPHKTYESYPEKTDIGFMALTSTGTVEVTTEFELLLVRTSWLNTL